MKERDAKFALQLADYVIAEANALKKLDLIKQDQELLRDNVHSARMELRTVEDQVIAAKRELQELRDLQKEVSVVKDRLESLNKQVSASNLHKLEIENDIDLLIRRKTERSEAFEQEVLMLQDEKLTLETTLAASTELIAKNEATLATLDKLTYDKRIEYNQFDTDIEAARRELAGRELALNERDRNVRLREQKAAQSEERIQQNANLLNL